MFIASENSERGAALVLAILSLLIVSSLAAAMLMSGRTEVLISRNHERAAQARAAAEAGLNHGIAVTVNKVRNWQVDGFASASAAMSSLLRGPDNLAGSVATDADNGSLETLGIPRPPARITLSATAGTAYDVRVVDEDDPARGLTLSVADWTRLGEDGVAATDADTRLLIRATGYAGGGTTATLEATIGQISLPALVTNGDLTVSGNATICGASGSIHSNGNLLISGSPSVCEDATASGTYTVTGSPTIGGQSGGGHSNYSVPPVRAIDYRFLADFVLTSGGQMTTLGGAVVCDASSDHDACSDLGYGWTFSGASGWVISSNSAAGGTYYVEGDARISGNPGSPASPLPLSIIATGNIEISGNPDLRPDLPELMFVTDMDLKINGNLGQPLAFEGQMLVHEQIMISGNPSLAGQILVEDAASVSNLVTSNTISGSMTLTYNGLVGSSTFAVTAWREVR